MHRNQQKLSASSSFRRSQNWRKYCTHTEPSFQQTPRHPHGRDRGRQPVSAGGPLQPTGLHPPRGRSPQSTLGPALLHTSNNWSNTLRVFPTLTVEMLDVHLLNTRPLLSSGCQFFHINLSFQAWNTAAWSLNWSHSLPSCPSQATLHTVAEVSFLR